MPAIDQYDVFKTMLLVILAFATVFNGGLAWALYIIIEKKIENRVDDLMNEIYFRSLVRTYSNIGYMCWSFAETEFKKTKKEPYLKQAVIFTNYAYKRSEILDKKNRENEKTICTVKNNLAFYLAECCKEGISILGRNLKENAKLAIDFADEIKIKISTYSDHTKEWLATYDHVQLYCRKYYKNKKT